MLDGARRVRDTEPVSESANVELVHRTWDALAAGDLAALEAALAPAARWRAVEDGPWNCENRAMILEVMARNLQHGLSGRIEEAFAVGDRVVVAFRPDDGHDRQWPLNDGVRHLVVTMGDGQVTEMKGCADRATALAYAGEGAPGRPEGSTAS